MFPSQTNAATGTSSAEFKSRRRRPKAAPKMLPSASLLFSSFLLVVSIAQELNLTASAQFLAAPEVPPRQAHLPVNQTSSNNSNNNNNNTQSGSSANSKADFLLNLVKTSFNQPTTGNLSVGGSASGGPGRLAPLLRAIENEKKQRAGQQREHYKTVYACEGNQLELGCPEGRLIHLSRALYGRFSLSICNDLGHSNFSVQCASFRAFLIMETRCNKLTNCSVTASKELFGDPCEGTSKYLEVQYYCHDVNQPSSSLHDKSGFASQQQQQQQPGRVGSGNQEQSSPKSETTSNNQPADTPSSAANEAHKSPAEFVGGSASSSQQQQPVGLPSSPVGQQQQHQQDSLPASDQQQSTVIQAGPFCSPQTSSRNLYWNLTRADQLARQACPEGAQGRVSWFCDGSAAHGLVGARFSPAWSPDFSQCRLIWLQNLEKQLERILEFNPQNSETTIRQQCEQLNTLVLTDLALMARTKELFSEDLRKIDQILSRILAHFRSLLDQPSRSSNRQPLFEDLFSKVVDVSSSLFELTQRNAWLEIGQPEVRRALELRLLNHIKEAGLLVSAVWPQSELELPLVRRPNVRAGLTSNANGFDAFRESLAMDTDEFNLPPIGGKPQGSFNYLSRLYQQPSLLEGPGESFNQPVNEFKVNTQLVRELVYKGAARFLVMDVRKPDYELIRHQLETEPSNSNNNLASEQQQSGWSSQVFGLFAVDYSGRKVIKNEDSLGRPEQPLKWSELLAKWPISVHFRQQLPVMLGDNQALAGRDCNLLSGPEESENQLAKCQTLKWNATDHVCRCDGFGFVSLNRPSSSNNNLLPVGLTPNDIQWPPAPEVLNQAENSISGDLSGNIPYGSEGPQAASTGRNAAGKQQTSQPAVWRSLLTFVVSLIVFVMLVGLVVSAFLRASASSRLSKKHNFLSANNNCNSIFAGPTTGPIPSGNNLIGADTIVNSSVSGSNETSVATHSNSMIGLNATCYKTHQQLYAAHLPPVDSSRLTRCWSSWLPGWRRPASLLSKLLATNQESGKPDHRAHHGIGVGLSNQSPLAYKGHYQNGYTTGLHQPQQISHQQQHNQQASRFPLTSAPTSSSTSSYVSSSAYYEEIGPGNLTKLHAHQLAPNSRALTMVDPFKRHPVATDQQHLINTNGNNLNTMHTLNQQHPSNQQQPAWLANNSHSIASGICQDQMFPSRPMNELGQQQHTPSSSGGPNPLQTGRHYLFASSTAVDAYKSSMVNSGSQQLHSGNFNRQLPVSTRLTQG